MHRKKIFIILIIVIYASITVWIKIKNNDSAFYDYDFVNVTASNDLLEVYGKKVNHKHITNLEELVNKSEIILIVNFDSYEQPYNDKTFANIKIQKVIKGTGFKKGETIKMFDDIGFGYVDSERGIEKYINIHNIYYPMYKDNDYIVFLNKDTEHEEYYRQSTKFYSRFDLDKPISCKISEELPQQKCDTFEINYKMYKENEKYEEKYKLIFEYREKIYTQIIDKFVKGVDTNED